VFDVLLTYLTYLISYHRITKHLPLICVLWKASVAKHPVVKVTVAAAAAFTLALH